MTHARLPRKRSANRKTLIRAVAKLFREARTSEHELADDLHGILANLYGSPSLNTFLEGWV